MQRFYEVATACEREQLYHLMSCALPGFATATALVHDPYLGSDGLGRSQGVRPRAIVTRGRLEEYSADNIVFLVFKTFNGKRVKHGKTLHV